MHLTGHPFTDFSAITADPEVKAVADEVEKQTGKTPLQILAAILSDLPQVAVLWAAKDYAGLLTLLLSLVSKPKPVTL